MRREPEEVEHAAEVDAEEGQVLQHHAVGGGIGGDNPAVLAARPSSTVTSAPLSALPAQVLSSDPDAQCGRGQERRPGRRDLGVPWGRRAWTRSEVGR